MDRETDLVERIARLERLLDALDQRRMGGHSADATPPEPFARLREAVSIVELRAARPDLDDGDRLGLRALLAELRSALAQLRGQAVDVEQQLQAIAARVQDGNARLTTIEESPR